MPYPSHFKKNPTTNILGCLRLGNIAIAVEDGWSETGYRLDYGPTNQTGFFAGATSTGGTFYSGTNEGPSNRGMLVNFTGTSPSYIVADGAGTQSFIGAYNSIDYVGAPTGLTIVQLASTYTNKDVVFLEAPLYPMVTSGLTCYYPFSWDYVAYGYSASTPYFPMIDITYNQNLGSAVNLGQPAGRVRGFKALPFNGVSSRLTISGSPTILTNSDFTWCGYHGFTVAGNPTGIQWLWTSLSGAQKNFAIRYFSGTTVGVSMVIETGSSTYSSTTSGTNFSGFSSNVGSAYFSSSPTSSANTPGWTVLRKSGSTFNLYWWSFFSNSPYNGLTKMWEVTINDWSIVNNNIPIYSYFNPATNSYVAGSIYTFGFYNRALSEKEIRYSLSGMHLTTLSGSFSDTGQTTIP